MGPDIAPMIVMVTAILTTGGVLVFRPISKRLGSLLEVMTQAKLKSPSADQAEVARLRETVHALEGRLALLEERQDFAEALMSAGDTKLLSIQSAQAAQDRSN